MRRVLVAIVGATATGKTAVAASVAEQLGGEVVCADARQLFRELEIGTGKPTAAERLVRPHHLFEWLTLRDHSTAGRWARAAAEVCESCFTRGTVPILVGGSGLYLSALQRGLHPEPPRDAGARAALELECETAGVEAMHARLRAHDPDAAASLSPRDRQRVLRALEITLASGRTLAWWREQPREKPLAAEWHAYQITCAPVRLREHIASRTRAMWGQGLVDEARRLVEDGLEPELRRLSAIGYDEALDHLAGSLSAGAAQARLNLRTGQLAKRQRTWFRHQFSATAIESDPGDGGAVAADIIGGLAGVN